MVDVANKSSKKRTTTGRQPSTDLVVQGEHRWTPLEVAVVELYGRGVSRKAIARTYVDRIAKPQEVGESMVRRLKRANRKLMALERRPWFRDKLFDLAIVMTDLQVTDILKGVVGEAKRGKVDAAKLALELTGRYSPQGETAPSNIQVHFGFLPRPDRSHITVEGVLLGEEEDVEDRFLTAKDLPSKTQ